MASFVPPQFAKFGKAVTDLLTKKFDYTNQVATKHKTSNGITVEAGGSSTDKGGFDGFAKGQYANKQYGTLDLEVNTNGKQDKQKVKVTLNQLYQSLELILTGDARKAAKAEVNFGQDFFAVNATVDTHEKNKKNLSAAASIGHDGLSVGATGATDLNAVVVDYNVGAEYAAKDATLTLYTTQALEEINAAVYNKVSPSTQVGTLFTHNPAGDAKKLSVGVEHAYDASTSLKTKLDSAGLLGAVVEHRLQNGPLLGVAGAFNVLSKTPFAATQVGVSVKLGDY